MGRSRLTLVGISQVARAGTAYSYRTISCIHGCGKSIVCRYVWAHFSPIRHSLVLDDLRDDIAMVDQALTAHRHATPIKLVPPLKDMRLVISESTLRRIMKKLALKRYAAQTQPFVNQRARHLRLDYQRKWTSQ